jgi:hypothetical protein
MRKTGFLDAIGRLKHRFWQETRFLRKSYDVEMVGSVSKMPLGSLTR